MDVREKTASKRRLIDYDEIRRLFDAQYKETVQLIHDGETHLDNLAEGFTEADRIIRKIPAVDAVEVVRCRECKHWKPSGSKAGNSFSDMEYIGGCEFTNYYRRESDFCSYGERKEGADNG